MRACQRADLHNDRDRLRFLCLLLAGASICVASGIRSIDAAETDVAPKAERSQLDLSDVREFLSQVLHRTELEGSVRVWGMQTRTVRGRVVDHTGQPIVGAIVAFVESAGFSNRLYDENFDRTDEQGRFLVESDLYKSQVVVWRGGAQVWSADVPATSDFVDVVWPQPATVRITVDEELLEPNARAITVASAEYWCEHSQLSADYQLDENRSVEITNQIPGDFVVEVHRSARFKTYSTTTAVEVGSFHAAPGEKIEVECRPSGNRRLSGKLPRQLNRQVTLTVDRVQTQYDDSARRFDLVACKDGMFETSPLPPGNYVLRFEQVPQRVQAVPGNRTDNLVSEWRQYVVVPEEDKPLTVDLQLPRDQGELRAIWLQNTLDSRGLPNLRWSFNRNLISSLVQNLDLDADQRELLRLYRDPEIPVMWKFRIPRKLGETLDSPEVLDALLEKLKPSNHLRDRLMALSALGNATQKTTEIVTAVSSYR